ncbi:hypothetical protein PRK78_006501 [Emydomyces testavorans]|uniref:PH domain-containing protein n=1 Tax=Emydomyces testavorans TaxID=2070801 RepID=A0AAF0DNL5_9EURO|nr:hypothetical protein PRK78_006501 [Emydomyces testavorans]
MKGGDEKLREIITALRIPLTQELIYRICRFLLKYVSRDVVALLARGTGGVAETRITIDNYEEKSPLYGFLHYRRRKVILRYVPEGISRLLQDTFSPHDTIFSLAVSSELTENALSSACLLHAASRSMTSSSSSLRRCQLGEITEDAEVEESASIADRSIAESALGVDNRRESVLSRTSEATAVPAHYRSEGSQAPSIAETASIRSRVYSEQRSDKPLPSVPRDYTRSHPNGVAQRHLLDQLAQPVSEPRNSTQSSRPSAKDLDQVSLRPPKVKLGPRPSVDINGRPRTAGSMGRSRDLRPVAVLPAGIRLTTRRVHASRPKSQPDLVPPILPLDVPPVPTLLHPPPVISSFSRNPPTSPKSVRSIASSVGVTPEKQRLMKALELRKRQMEKLAQEAGKCQKEAVTPERADTTDSQEGLIDPDMKGLSVTTTTCGETAGVLPMQLDERTIPSQSHEESSLDVADKAKAPITDPSKLDSAVDLSIAEQSSQKGASVLASVSDTDVTELPEVDGDNTSTSNLENVGNVQGSMDGPGESNASANPSDPEDVSVCEIEIRSGLQSADTPTPRAISVGFLQSTESEFEGAAVQQDEVVSMSENTSQHDTEFSQPEAEQVLDHPSDNQRTFTFKERKEKRRPLLNPIRIPPRHDDLDEENLLSDDSFMEELKSATVEQAKPVAVPRTPLTTFSNGGDITSSERWKGSRVVSNPSAGGLDVQALPVGRSTSGTYFGDQDAVPVLVAKKVNVSSGISKRIRALERFSSRDSGSSQAPVLPSPSASTSPFEKFRKRASMTQNNVLSPSNTSKGSKSPLPPEASTQMPKRRESLSAASSMKGKSNSVCVTARIVRDPSVPPPDPAADPSEPSVLNLQRSQLIVEHDGNGELNLPTSPTSPPAKQERKRWSISSISSKHVPDPTPLRRSDSSMSKLSISSRSKPDGTLSRSSTDTHGHLDSVDEVLEEKKESRKSRLMRRMSTITSNSRWGIMNALGPTLNEEDPPTPPPKDEEEQTPEAPQVVDIGEVNVQFPDTLLWKRRFLRIDDNGYLILTPGTIDGTARNSVKRYHLSEFQTPCLPDQDRQELPNSIVFDFKNGSTLQCACESRQDQRAVLQSKFRFRAWYQSIRLIANLVTSTSRSS